MPDYQPGSETKVRLDMLLSMSPEERKVFFLTEKVESERYYHDELLSEYKTDRTKIQQARHQRKRVQLWAKRLDEARQMLKRKEQSDKQSQ